MPVVEVGLLGDNPHPKTRQVYGGLDACITLEVFYALKRGDNKDESKIAYNFLKALQAPALDMMLRGFKIDEEERQKATVYLQEQINHYSEMLNEFAFAVWEKKLNPRSHQQLKEFFYDYMKIPKQWISIKGEKKLSMNRETLEKLQVYFHAQPFINLIFIIRDLSKQLSVLETEIDSDGRMRTSYNISGTESLRWSSSSSVEGTGTNLQNIPIDPRYDPEDWTKTKKRSIRKLFIADPGYELCGIDLEQAESREVGFQCGVLFNDWSYLDACESGDLHSLTAKLIWPKLPWTGDPKKDREIAEQKFYREFSYRDMSKRGGHGSNYLGTPFTMARHLKVPTRLMEDFQAAYFTSFPGIPKWHRWTAQKLQQEQKLTTPFGITRHFFGRPNDDSTLREAIAFVPQSATAVRLNLALWRIWNMLMREYKKDAYLVAQVHDALYFQYRTALRDEIIPRALSLMDIPLFHNGRRFSVPGEAKIGLNWGNFHKDANPGGLKKWKKL